MSSPGFRQCQVAPSRLSGHDRGSGRFGFRLTFFVLLCLFLGSPREVQAQPRQSEIPVLALEGMRVAVVTFGPGDHPFAKFGHDAIWVELPDKRGAIYNFGTFSGESSTLIAKFLKGRFNYWLSVSPPRETLAAYANHDRTVLIQELALTPGQKRELWRRLEINALPENREYLYDYFKDNCSTRVRDALNAVLEGKLEADLAQKPARLTFRGHALRLSADLPWLYVGLHLGLGQEADAPRTRWEEGFIPEGVANALDNVFVERNGKSVPLVSKKTVYYQAQRPEAPAIPPVTWYWFLLTGLVLGAFLALPALLTRSPWARITFGATSALFGLVFGLLGTVLLFLWMFTNHQIAYRNENITLMPPFLLCLLITGFGVALGRQKSVRATYWVFLGALLLSVLGLALKATPWFYQSNFEFILFFTPIWLAGAVAARSLARSKVEADTEPRREPADLAPRRAE